VQVLRIVSFGKCTKASCNNAVLPMWRKTEHSMLFTIILKNKHRKKKKKKKKKKKTQKSQLISISLIENRNIFPIFKRKWLGFGTFRNGYMQTQSQINKHSIASDHS